MEHPPSPQKSRSQSLYNTSTSSTQQLKTMATATTTTTANPSTTLNSPRTKSSQPQHSQDSPITPNSPAPSSSTGSLCSISGNKSKKRPLPKESSSKNNNNSTTSDSTSKVIVTTPANSTGATATKMATTTVTALRNSTRPAFDISQITHDEKTYMFKLCLDSKGTIAALCYLPTRYATLVEFYHTEVPLAYRHMGIGDLLVKRAFEWVEQAKFLVIPSCPFVLRYLKTHYPDTSSGQWKYTAKDERDGLRKLAHRI